MANFDSFSMRIVRCFRVDATTMCDFHNLFFFSEGTRGEMMRAENSMLMVIILKACRHMFARRRRNTKKKEKNKERRILQDVTE